MSFLNVEDKTYLVSGVANKKSVAYFTAKLLQEEGAKVIFTVLNEATKEKVAKLFPGEQIFICDVNKEDSIKEMSKEIKEQDISLAGFLHSIAFANYKMEKESFLDTKSNDFLEATNISCLSLVTMSRYLKDSFSNDASIVTVSISNTKATSYGYMGPIKAALDSAVPFLAKSFSEFSNIRVNAVCSGPLKTSAAAGIPGYIDNYLFAEQLTLRKKALKTSEVANTISFLLSPRSSGINGAGLTIDAGMSCNYFDEDIVNKFAKY